jgi:2-keto-4-pentenoate hydratase
VSADRLQRAVQFMVALRSPGPRPLSLPPELAPRTEAEAYELQEQIAHALHAVAGAWKVAMSGLNAGSFAPVYASELYSSGARVQSAIGEQLGVEPEVAFTLKRSMPPLSAGTRYTREQVIDAIGSAHAAIEIVVSRFQKHETAQVLDRLADNISNAGLVLGPPCEHWREIDFAEVPLKLTTTTPVGEPSVFRTRGGHPQNDPLIPMVWIVADRAARGPGLKAGDVVTTGSYAGLRYLARGARLRVEFTGLGAVELHR